MPAIIKSGQLQVVQTKDGVVVGRDDDEVSRLTAEMEIVARAKGSPIMLPVLTPRRPYCLEFSILRKDGE